MERFASRYARPKRSVRLHLEGGAPSIEGVLIGRWRGSYVLENARVLSAAGKSHALEGYVEVEARKVIFMQVIPPDPPTAPTALSWVSS